MIDLLIKTINILIIFWGESICRF